jgi:AcrR family transcriptional regulator
MPEVAVGIRGTGAEITSPTPDVRERLTDAVTRAATECGYPAVDVEQIAQYAGVSVEEFNQHFEGKDQCLLAAYDRFLERMLEHIDEACEEAENWPEKVRCTIESAFDFVTELDGAARLFAVDSMRTGPAAVELACSAIDSAALRLKHGRLLFPAAAQMPDPTERTLVAGVVMIASIQLLSEEASQLPHLAPEAVEMVLTPYVGARRARSIATQA